MSNPKQWSKSGLKKMSMQGGLSSQIVHQEGATTFLEGIIDSSLINDPALKKEHSMLLKENSQIEGKIPNFPLISMLTLHM